MELEKAKSLEKIIKQQKKEALKRQLDEQITYKNYIGEAAHK